jgi:RNA polymerase sigma-70 factor (ECF subfamily)
VTATAIWTEFRASVAGYFARRGVPASDVDDCVQDVFLRVHKGLPSLRDEERVGPWLFTIARNVLRDRLRRPDEPTPVLGDSILEGDPILEDAEPPMPASMRRCILSMVDSLDEPYRGALHAVELDGESQADAARRLGLSHTGMKSRVQRGRAKLRASFDACCRVEWDTHGQPGCGPCDEPRMSE